MDVTGQAPRDHHMISVPLKLDVAGFKNFGKKALACKKEQVAQLCWNGDPGSPVTIEGKRSGGVSSCRVSVKEGTACYEQGTIPIGLVHTHPDAIAVEVDPTKPTYDDPTLTAFSPADVLSILGEHEGMTGGLVSCLAGLSSFACLAPKEHPPGKELFYLNLENQAWIGRIRDMQSSVNKRVTKPTKDELRRINVELNDLGNVSRLMARDIIEKYGTPIESSYVVKTPPTIDIPVPLACEVMHRHDDKLRDWMKNEELLRKKSAIEAKKGSLKKIADDARMKVTYIDHRDALETAMKNFGKC